MLSAQGVAANQTPEHPFDDFAVRSDFGQHVRIFRVTIF